MHPDNDNIPEEHMAATTINLEVIINLRCAPLDCCHLPGCRGANSLQPVESKSSSNPPFARNSYQFFVDIEGTRLSRETKVYKGSSGFKYLQRITAGVKSSTPALQRTYSDTRRYIMSPWLLSMPPEPPPVALEIRRTGAISSTERANSVVLF